MITCRVNALRGTASVVGSNLPVGKATVTRSSPGERPYSLRGGSFDVNTGAFIREDSEASFGIPLKYTLDMDIPLSERLIQRNLVLTPTFLHGMQSWAPGQDRDSAVVSDSTAFSPVVGTFGKNPSGVSIVDAPSLVGHVESTAGVTGNYTLTPGGTIANGDLVYIVHTQNAQYADPTIAGFTLVTSKIAQDTVQTGNGLYPSSTTYPSTSLYPGSGSTSTTTLTPTAVKISVFSRIRVGGDSGYTVTNVAGSETMATMLWMRNVSATYTPVISDFKIVAPPNTASSVVVPGVTLPRPALNLTLVAGHSVQRDVYVTATVTGTTKQYGMSSRAPINGVFLPTEADRVAWNSFVNNTLSSFNSDTSRPNACDQAAFAIINTGIGNPSACITQGLSDLLVSIAKSSSANPLGYSLLSSQEKALAVIAANFAGYSLASFIAPGKITRSLTVGAQTFPNAGNTLADTFAYNEVLSSAVGVQIGLQANVSMAPRVIASVRTGAMPASAVPYLMTGRFKYRTPDLWLWADVLNQGTWANLKTTKNNWLSVKSQSSQTDDSYVRLFVNIVDAAGTVIYVNPVQVITLTDSGTNQWMAFNFFFDVSVDIPAGSKIQLFHGTSLREYAVDWSFDRFGITSGEDRLNHNVVDWFSGDSNVPFSPEDNLFPSGDWDAASDDAAMVWEGAPGNSVSRYTGPSKITTNTTCIIQVPDFGKDACEPIYLNDPITPPRGQWYSLMRVDPLAYNARQQVLDIINRNAQIVVSQSRAWASGTLTIMTRTLLERTLAIQTFETGRILLLRNPNPEYPESGWYVAIGTVSESRLGVDQRRPERLWTVPFIRVERPSGLIDSAIGQTWGQLKTSGLSWGGVKTNYINWLDILSAQKDGVLGFGLGDYVPPSSDYVPVHVPVDIQVSGNGVSYSNTIGTVQNRFGGSALSTSVATGKLVQRMALSGSATAASATQSATVSGTGAIPVSGTNTNPSVTTGAVALRRPATGSSASTSSTTGAGSLVNPSALTAYRDGVIAQSPALYLRMGEASGTTATDSSGNARNGTYSGGYTLGQASAMRDGNKAAKFTTASSGALTVAHNAAFNLATGPGNAWTIMFLLRPDTITAGTYPGIVVKGSPGTTNGGWGIYREPSVGSLSFKHNNIESYSAATSAINVVELGVWAHWTVSYDGANIRWYKDGILAHTQAWTTVSAPSNTSALILNLMDSYGDNTIDEFAIFPTTLTPSKIGELAQLVYEVGAQVAWTGPLNAMAGYAIPGTHLAYDINQTQLDLEMGLVAAAGAKYIRFDFAAVQIETTSGVRDWSNIDRIVTAATNKGLTPVGILTTLPAWSAANYQVGPTTTAQRNAFTSFATAAVTRYPQITLWEVWNEPNNASFWTSPSVADYVLLLKAAYPVIKAANSSAQVLMGGTAGGQSSPNDTESWFTGLYSNTAKAYFDIANMHPYPDGSLDPVLASSGEMSHIAAIRATMSTNTDTAKKIWATESGFPTGGTPSTTEAKQVVLLKQLYQFWKKATGSQRGPFLVYTLYDIAAYQPDREGYFGVISSGGTAKPGYKATYDLNIVELNP